MLPEIVRFDIAVALGDDRFIVNLSPDQQKYVLVLINQMCGGNIPFTKLEPKLEVAYADYKE